MKKWKMENGKWKTGQRFHFPTRPSQVRVRALARPVGACASARAVLLLSGLAAGCGPSVGPADDLRAQIFEVPYQSFIADAGGHRATCEIAVSARGEQGRLRDELSSAVEVDDAGNYRVRRGDGWETVRVGSISWQRPKGGGFARVESGARADLLRDAAAAGWRLVLAPVRSRLAFTRTGSKELGEREIEVYRVIGDPGGGGDGGAVLERGEGTVEVDARTGFPVSFRFRGAFSANAPTPAVGRVAYDVESIACSVTVLGGIAPIPPPTVAR